MATIAPRTNGRASRVPTIALEPEQVEGSQLAAAVLRVQAAAPKLIPNEDGRVGPRTYRYVTNDALVDAVLPLLVTENLLWRAFPTTLDDGSPALRYRMTHIPSGESEEDVMNLACVRDPQGQGSGITYARRYALVAYLNLTVDPDDDGAAASQPPPVDRYAEAGSESGSTVPAQPTAREPAKSERPANAKQQAMLRGKAAGLSPERVANLILLATGEPERDWSDEDAAARWVARAIERLPAVHVTELKTRLEAAKA